jgi:hypothetical protein
MLLLLFAVSTGHLLSEVNNVRNLLPSLFTLALVCIHNEQPPHLGILYVFLATSLRHNDGPWQHVWEGITLALQPLSINNDVASIFYCKSSTATNQTGIGL